MLTYQFNIAKAKSDLKPIALNYSIKEGDDYKFPYGYSVREFLGDLGLSKMIFVAYCSDEVSVHEGERILVTSNLTLEDNSDVTTAQYSFSNTYKVESVNAENQSFTFLVDRFHTYSVNTLSIVEDEDTGDTYWYFYFDENHFFSKDEENIQIYIKYVNEGGEYIYKEIPCEYMASTILRYRYDDGDEDIRQIEELIFSDGSDVGQISNVDFLRDQFLYRIDGDGEPRPFNSTVTIYSDVPLANVRIPLSNVGADDMYKDENIREYFTEEEERKSINRITEMEKDIYHPVMLCSDELKDIYNIRFNLHFRQHRGKDWTVQPDTYWNGVDNETVDFRSDGNFFSYDEDGYGRQSDLLSYLGFVNNDVKFQKNTLKKSFLRLSFYDSMNPTDQNLLFYSTIFMDSGKYFTKYIKYLEDEPYVISGADGDKAEKTYVGIKVDREPYDTLIKGLSEDEIEEKRLSSQIEVGDRYSESSSDGFYLYLWKDNENGRIPTDLYLKVEFNHAGYGRTIPFMMPFFDESADEKDGVKTFDEILQDWRDGKFYGLKKYTKYSYIHLKYKYDTDKKRHVYYLADDAYGDDVCEQSFKDGTLNINLYEAKLSYDNAEEDKRIVYTYDYGDIEITKFEYNMVSSKGGTVYPVVEYTQTVTKIGSDGSSETFIVTNGAQLKFEDLKGGDEDIKYVLSRSNGKVSVSTQNISDERLVTNVSVTVSLNGKTADKEVEVRQKSVDEKIVGVEDWIMTVLIGGEDNYGFISDGDSADVNVAIRRIVHYNTGRNEEETFNFTDSDSRRVKIEYTNTLKQDDTQTVGEVKDITPLEQECTAILELPKNPQTLILDSTLKFVVSEQYRIKEDEWSDFEYVAEGSASYYQEPSIGVMYYGAVTDCGTLTMNGETKSSGVINNFENGYKISDVVIFTVKNGESSYEITAGDVPDDFIGEGGESTYMELRDTPSEITVDPKGAIIDIKLDCQYGAEVGKYMFDATKVDGSVKKIEVNGYPTVDEAKGNYASLIAAIMNGDTVGETVLADYTDEYDWLDVTISTIIDEEYDFFRVTVPKNRDGRREGDITFIHPNNTSLTRTVHFIQEYSPVEYTFTFEDGTKSKKMTIPSDGGDYVYHIISRSTEADKIEFTWNESADTFLHVTGCTYDSGSKYYTVTLHADKNESKTDERHASITFAQNGESGLTIGIDAVQEYNPLAYEFHYDDGETSKDLTAVFESKEYTFNIVSKSTFTEQVPFTYIPDTSVDFVTYVGSEYDSVHGYYVVTISLTANESINERYANVSFRQGEESGMEIDLNITQAGDQTIVIPNFDFLVTRYHWSDSDGRDLDSATSFSGTQIDELDEKFVGYLMHEGKKEYIEHGGDNMQSGNECVLMKFKNVCSTDNLLFFKERGIKDIYTNIYCNWYIRRDVGNIEIELIAYKGGEMIKDPDNYYNFINVGGEEVFNRAIPTNVCAIGKVNPSNFKANHDYYTHVGDVRYNINSRSATLTVTYDTGGNIYTTDLSVDGSLIKYVSLEGNTGDIEIPYSFGQPNCSNDIELSTMNGAKTYNLHGKIFKDNPSFTVSLANKGMYIDNLTNMAVVDSTDCSVSISNNKITVTGLKSTSTADISFDIRMKPRDETIVGNRLHLDFETVTEEKPDHTDIVVNNTTTTDWQSWRLQFYLSTVDISGGPIAAGSSMTVSAILPDENITYRADRLIYTDADGVEHDVQLSYSQFTPNYYRYAAYGNLMPITITI